MYQGGMWGGPHAREDREYPSLCAWIDQQIQGGYDNVWGIYGGVAGTIAGLCGALSGILVGTMPQNGPILWPAIWIPYFVGMGAYAISIGRRAKRLKQQEAERFGPNWQSTRNGLHVARWRGGLRATFGDEGARLLDQSAGNALKVFATMDSEAWRARNDGVYGSAKENVKRNLDAAMARLILSLQAGGGVPVQAKEIASDIQSLAEEVAAISVSPEATSQSESGLRETLSELREIRCATDEAQEAMRISD
ncbi:MAG: hypothetical protein KF812_06875 [Fimbriimonadaceae bacterium]|nr:hypothetical protein [Fimbriimonadaceae bacterium]